MQDSLQRWPKSIAYIVGMFEEVGIGARAPPSESDRALSCPTRTHRRRPCDKTSGGLNALQGGRDSDEQGADVLPKECDRADTNHGNQPDQHAVFDKGSAFLVTAETIDELHHVEVFQRCIVQVPDCLPATANRNGAVGRGRAAFDHARIEPAVRQYSERSQCWLARY
jgi:hypothetical protein